MADETVYKRDTKGKELSKANTLTGPRLRFKDTDVDLDKTILIGRDKVNDIVITDDALVSRKHAIIEKEGDCYYFVDKDSTNGSYLNNNPVPKNERVELSSGDQIQVGKTKLKITL